jgi:hypothetical protein
VLLRQLLLPFHDFAGEANKHVVFIGLSINRDAAEGGVFYLHGVILVRSPQGREPLATPILRAQRQLTQINVKELRLHPSKRAEAYRQMAETFGVNCGLRSVAAARRMT